MTDQGSPVWVRLAGLFMIRLVVIGILVGAIWVGAQILDHYTGDEGCAPNEELYADCGPGEDDRLR